MKSNSHNPNKYWLALAACYGTCIGLTTITDMPWLLIVGGVFIIFPLVIGLYFGQIGRNVNYQLLPDSPAIVITATACGIAALVLRDSPLVAWAAPVLGIVTFIGTYLCLRRYGHFYRPAQGNSQDKEREHAPSAQ